VCAETDNPKSAIALFEQHQPKIVVLGVITSRGDGLQLIKTLLKTGADSVNSCAFPWMEGVHVEFAGRYAAGAGWLSKPLKTVNLELPIALDSIAGGNLLPQQKACGPSF